METYNHTNTATVQKLQYVWCAGFCKSGNSVVFPSSLVLFRLNIHGAMITHAQITVTNTPQSESYPNRWVLFTDGAVGPVVMILSLLHERNVVEAQCIKVIANTF